MVSIIMDVLLVGIIVLAAYRGFRKGIIASVIGLVSLVVAIYGANLLAVTFSGEFVGVLEPFVSGIVDSTEAKILSYGSGSEAEESGYVPAEPVNSEDAKSAYKVSYSVLKELGLDDKIVEERENGLVNIRIRTWDGGTDYYLDFGEPAYTAGVGA
ncbi:MAG: CvpA family protein, partial [Oscillospiraceae bacterium]|nr:CvpA family protein [Oscillospiraceae bacterium]